MGRIPRLNCSLLFYYSVIQAITLTVSGAKCGVCGQWSPLLHRSPGPRVSQRNGGARDNYNVISVGMQPATSNQTGHWTHCTLGMCS